jgi:hypothetical protein
MRPQWQEIAVRGLPAVARIVLDHERHGDADEGGETAEDEVGVAPSQGVDEERGERWHDKRSHTDPADGETGRETATPHEPALHRAKGGHVGAADAQSDAEPIGRVDVGEAAGGAGESETEAGQRHPDHGQPAAPQRSASGPLTIPRPK